MQNAELDHGSHGLTRMGTKLGTRGDARPPYPWNPRQSWLHFAESGLQIAECRKDELGMQELEGGILATDGSYGRSPSGKNTESGGGRRWGSAGASPYRPCGRSIIRRGEFHESPFLPIRVPSVANNLLMVIRLRIADCGLRKPKRGGEQPKLINSEWLIPDFLIS